METIFIKSKFSVNKEPKRYYNAADIKIQAASLKNRKIFGDAA